jgi:hypothetical protein
VVFGGKVAAQNLVIEILRSRNASLFYSGLLSLDEDTRAWLAGERELVADLSARHPAAFLVAAPGLRVSGKVVRVPGGIEAEPVWEALVGRRTNEPEPFIRALLMHRDGRLAYFFGAMSQLTAAQRRAALQLDDASDTAARVNAARRLFGVFERLAPSWRVADRAFWRPMLDPALLIADLRVDDEGRPRIPGTRQFWSAVFAGPGGSESPVPSDVEPVDLPWLFERVFEDPGDYRRRYQLVLYASRAVPSVPPAAAREAIDVVRAAGAFPALTAVLERARISDVSAIAAAARRAADLSGIDDEDVATRSLAQFQGTLAVLVRATVRGSLSSDSAAAALSSMSAIDLDPRGEYEGRLVRWIAGWLSSLRAQAKASAGRRAGPSAGHADVDRSSAAGLDGELVRLLAGAAPIPARVVEWEGTRYRVDLAAAEAARLARLLGDHPRPYLTSAHALVGTADVLSGSGLTRDALRQQAATVEEIAKAAALDDTTVWGGAGIVERYREASAALKRAGDAADIGGARRLSSSFLTLADDLLGRGLMEVVYAVALGQPDSVPISAADAASRHDFGLSSPGMSRRAAWQLPASGSDSRRGWHVAGALLGLDVKLAEFSLLRLSLKPPARRPTLNDEDRRVLIESAALVEAGSLTDADRDAIVAAMRRGRARLADVKTAADAAALADDIPLSPARRTLLSWAAVHDPDRVPAFLSPLEQMWLGLERPTRYGQLDAWGVSSEPRLGCLCRQMIDRRPWETLSGRWSWGLIASGFPDLNLRLAELLADLKMPAVLLGPVLASATLDLINGAASRDGDDRRGLVEFVRALKADRVEEYLALLTTDGPLVPIEDISPGPDADLRAGAAAGGLR